jgi:threonine synthase
MSFVTGLSCRECARRYPVSAEHVCMECFGPLEVSYDLEAARVAMSARVVAAGPGSLWRYGALLPVPADARVDLGAGLTPLRAAPRLAAELGLRRLWVKNEGTNPTHSFKDRVVSVAVGAARSFGYGVVACASTGNLANALAAHGAAAGMRSVVFVPDTIEEAKLAATAVYGGTVVAVKGSYDDANRLCAELAGRNDWAFVNVNLRPFYAEGSKTVAFEIAEQLGWRLPQAIVVPIAAGSLLTKIAKGFRELGAVGAVPTDAPVRIFGGQAEGCAPVAAAYAEGREDIVPVRPDTVARSLAIGDPADGRFALLEARASDGAIACVPEAEVAQGMRLLARTEGLFTETAGGVAVATLEQLVRSGRLAPDEEVVLVITGVGLKTTGALRPVRPTHHVRARVDELERALAGSSGAPVGAHV